MKFLTISLLIASISHLEAVPKNANFVQWIKQENGNSTTHFKHILNNYKKLSRKKLKRNNKNNDLNEKQNYKQYLDVDPNSILPLTQNSHNPLENSLKFISLITTTIFPTTTEKIYDYDNTPVIQTNGEISFYANESFLHFRTESWFINFDNCLEFKYRIEGKRTR